jgi:hypothetical protein
VILGPAFEAPAVIVGLNDIAVVGYSNFTNPSPSIPFPWYIRSGIRLDPAMPTHKFHVGQLVQLIPAISRNVPGGSFEITKKLPERDGE